MVQAEKKCPYVQPGRYRHYKGNDYQVMDVARHSETEEWFVIYQTRYKNEKPSTSIRPADMFLETVTINGEEIPRFQFMGDIVP